MGNCSDKSSQNQNSIQKVGSGKFDTGVLQEQSNTVKNKTHGYIQSGDLNELKKYMQQNKVKPNEELSVKGWNWNTMHYACYFKKVHIFHYLLELVCEYYVNDEDKQKVLENRTKSGWDLVMICCIYNSLGCLKLLLEFGGVNLSNVDDNQLSAQNLSQKYGSIECFAEIEKFIKMDMCGLIPINSKLKTMSTAEINNYLQSISCFDNNVDQHPLCINGTRKPCVICNGNKGYIKYTACCGKPMHLICFDENPHKDCQFCGYKGFVITGTVKVVENAFETQ